MSFGMLLAGCDVHEFPRPEDPSVEYRSVTVNLRFDLAMPIYREIEYGDGMRRTRTEALERRYIIRIFDEVRGTDTRSPRGEWVYYRPAEENPDTTVNLDIPAGDYRMMVWCDFVSGGERGDIHYDPSSFEEITLRSHSDYAGSDERRDAFRGDVQVPATGEVITVGMNRPLARYVFITNDLDKFVGDRTKGEDGDIDLSWYGVRFVYPRYMACSFNMFTNRPADSWTGVVYESSMRQLDNDRAEVGFDYVFVNSHDTSVNVAVEVYDRRDGTVLAGINPIDVPLSRSGLTVVTGPFLTTKTEGGVGISPDFDGEFNIEIK